jgi:hypothetical protein
MFALDMAGGVSDLAAFIASGQVRKFYLQPLGDTRELDLLLSRSDLERERGS